MSLPAVAPLPPKPPTVAQRAAITMQAVKRVDSSCSAVMLLATHAGAYEQSSTGSATKWAKRPIEGVPVLYTCSNGKVKFVILNRLQLDCKDDIVNIDEHVAVSRTGHWLFVLKEAPQRQRGEKQQECYGYWFMLESEAESMETEMERVVNSLLIEQGLPTSPIKHASSRADVRAILQGSTGMIKSSGGGGGGQVDVGNTNALLKHLNIGSKLARSTECSQSPPLEPMAASVSAAAAAAASSSSSSSSLPLSLLSSYSSAASSSAAASSQSVLEALGSAFAINSGHKPMSQQQFNSMVEETLKTPSQMQALFAAYERALARR